MAIQNPLYGKDLSEDEAVVGYQPKNDTLTKLTTLSMPGTPNYYLSLNAQGTDFIWVPTNASNTDALPEGTTNLYLTSSRVRAAITGAISDITSSNLTPSRALITDANGKVVISTVTASEVSHLAGTTSNLQTQLTGISTTIGGLTSTSIGEGTNQYFTNARAVGSITGGASTITTTNLTGSRVLASDSNGKVVASTITSAELGYLAGATSNLQTQVTGLSTTITGLTTTSITEGTNQYFTPAKAVAAITGAASTIATTNLSTSRALTSDGTGKVSASAVTTSELGYLTGTTSAIQTQINTLTGRTVTVGSGMTGGGNLSSNISIGLSFDASTSNIKMDGVVSLGTLSTVSRADHVHPSDTSKMSVSLLGVANGVATLDSASKVPVSQIPALTTQMGFGGETITVPYTGSGLTIPVLISQGGTGATTAASALASLGAQTYYPVLTSLHTAAGVGLVAKNADGLINIRTLQVNNPITITNPTGGTTNPTISLLQGAGSGLDADLLDGLQGSSYLRTDGVVTYTGTPASTIRTSILAASSGSNSDITDLSAITGLGNTNNSHIQITNTGSVGIGVSPTLYGKVAIKGGSAGTGNTSLAVMVPDGTNGLRASISLYPTFANNPDTNARRAADIIAGYDGGVWGTEYLSFNVANSNDTRSVTTERVRIDSLGNVLVGRTATTTNAGDVQVSRGLTFPGTQVPCSNVNTLDDYKEGTWTPVIETSTPGTGRVTSVNYAGFTKIGNMVTFTAYISLTTLGTGGSGYTVINGLPYTPLLGSGQAHWAVCVPFFLNLKSNLVYLAGTVQPGSPGIVLRGTNGSTGSLSVIDFATYMQTSVTIMFSGFYYI